MRRTVEVVVRGCILRVPAEMAEELRAAERLMMHEDWANNRVD